MAAVVVPMHNRKELLPEEQISLRHLLHYLGKYDKYLVVPKSLKFEDPNFGLKRFSDRFFGSKDAYTRLIFYPGFYEAFSDYEYILVYHLDSLVFSDQLMEWCKKGFDLIGAPWIKHSAAPYAGREAFEGKVGNGGFSLVKVESCLKVIYSRIYHVDPAVYRESWQNRYGLAPVHQKLIHLPKKYLKRLRLFNGVRWEMARWESSGDHFWTNRAKHYYPPFRIAPVESALRFAFECMPRYCFELTNRTLPFGCHAWARYDRGFWEPYLLK